METRPMSNPAFSNSDFRRAYPADASGMTVRGTAVKATLLLLGLVTAGAMVWEWLASQPPETGGGGAALLGALLAGILLAVIICIKPRSAPVLAPLYAGAEGVVLGALSFYMEREHPGIVFNAVLLTAGISLIVFVAYAQRLIVVTNPLWLWVVSATGAVALIYLVDIALMMFGVRVPFIHESGWLGIGFSLFVIVLASFNLLLDLDGIEHRAKAGAPKYMEWYCAFGLLVTLVWLYLEVLRLLAKLADD